MSEIHQYKLRNGSSPAWYDEGTGPTPDAWHLDCVQPDHIWRTVYQQGHEAALSQTAGVVKPLPMDTAPRDGTMVRLLVEFTDHATEDCVGPAWTIGANNDDEVGEDERVGWQFAGWCWTHDHFTEGRGKPVGWLPMLAAAPAASGVDTSTNEAWVGRAQEKIAAMDSASVRRMTMAEYTTGHCPNHNQPGGCQLHNLQCGWPNCDRRQVQHQPQAAIAGE